MMNQGESLGKLIFLEKNTLRRIHEIKIHLIRREKLIAKREKMTKFCKIKLMY